MDGPPTTIPLSTFGLDVLPDQPASVNEVTQDTAVRITMAALDIKSSDSTAPTVVKITTRPNFGDDYPLEEDEEDEEEEVISIVCTLSPKHLFQQQLDLFCLPNEQVVITTEGPHAVCLSGYLIDHPMNESEDEGSDEDSEGEYSDSEDEDELDLTSNVRIEELEDSEKEEEEEKPVKAKKETKAVKDKESKETKNAKKRAAEETEAPAADKSKKQKKTEEKKVAFSKELEQGPTGKDAKKAAAPAPTTKKLAGGVVTEDKKVGSGPVCKKGDKVSVRYIGKLQNGKTFDSNTSGKPFQFKLGAGQVIKGWDVGVAGMSVKGERRIVIPAPMAYGSQKLPGIPANSTLTFDVKLVGIK